MGEWPASVAGDAVEGVWVSSPLSLTIHTPILDPSEWPGLSSWTVQLDTFVPR